MTQSKYDIIYILDPNSTADEIASVASKVEQVTADVKGSVVKKDEWGRRRLAYHIGRHREGHYVFYEVSVEPTAIDEIARNLRLLEKVIKYQVVKEEISHRKIKPARKKTSRPAGMDVSPRPSPRPAPRPAAPVEGAPVPEPPPAV